jgi:TonB dependent receptor/CarboxypepD_reg-like domain/TonB-dependent Receptor Plug Domain
MLNSLKYWSAVKRSDCVSNFANMRLFSTFFLALICFHTFAQSPGNRQTVSGYIREIGSQEALIGVNVRVPGTQLGAVTNTYGFYSITLPAQDSVRLSFSFVGYETVYKTLNLRRDQTMNVSLVSGRLLSEVTVQGQSQLSKVSETAQMSQISIPIEQIKKIPTLLGEKDVLKVLQLMPGVQKGSEGQTGLYVRGGGPDQNLIILDDAVVYNASHLFGFFSTFNGDALKSVELTKGGFPARFGGRLSSVIELNMKEGSKDQIHGEGGIGLIASRLTLEGPIKFNKNKPAKSSFLVSARRTYLDVLAAPLIAKQTDGQTSAGYYFYDLNAKLNYDFGPKNKLYLSGYFGRDRFFASDNESGTKLGLGWGNQTATLRWNHLFSQKLFANLSAIYSRYNFNITADDQSDTQNKFSLKYDSGIRDFGLKYDVDFYPAPAHALRFGVQTTYHRFTPSAVVLQNSNALGLTQRVNNIDVFESGIYAEDNWRPTDKWRINGGLRLSAFSAPGVTYLRPEPRLSVAYIVRPNLSFKAAYSRMNQYVHLLSNTGIGLPTDLWVPTTDRVAPQQSEQVAAGLAKDFSGNSAIEKGLTLTVEGYYKTMNNIINYKEGASFLFIDDPTSAKPVRWEDNVTAGRGWSYGAEVLLQKKTGRFTGWIGYTLSWTKWQFPDLNGGRPFFPRYDRRHDASVVLLYDITPRISVSGVWVYGTGQALTVPNARVQSALNRLQSGGGGTLNSQLFNLVNGRDYGPEKNSFRAEPYHRLDFAVQFHKQKKHHERIWEFSVYNLYNRRNPFFYNIETKKNTTETVLYRYSVFPLVPSFSYSFRF